jgi:hypothetical protein
MDYEKNDMSIDKEKGRGNERARVTRGSRNPKHGNSSQKHFIIHTRIRVYE